MNVEIVKGALFVPKYITYALTLKCQRRALYYNYKVFSDVIRLPSAEYHTPQKSTLKRVKPRYMVIFFMSYVRKGFIILAVP